MAAGQLLIPYSTPALTAIGQVAAGATVTVYNTGTFDLADLFADYGLSTPIDNPLTANSAGRFTDQSTVIWANDTQAYDVVLDFPDGSNLTFENIVVLEIQSSVSGYAPINSPTFTGTPTAPTPLINDNSNKLATTAFVKNQNYAPLADPAFTGDPTAPTPAPGDNSTSLATTAFVDYAVNALTSAVAADPGYFQVNNLLINFGSYALGTGGGASVSVTFAKPFAAILGAWVGVDGSAAQMIGTNGLSNSGMTVSKGAGDSGSTRAGSYYAIGLAF